ncbi:GIY-YIG nuclease family protein [Bacillus cereus]|uniref:GIY-YIG nuclease family protein n=1 Tax=Bacillus cereus TaxID=1396 RepID=UPI000BFE85F6|nr:GIY-YIG nuclease family protein [Bacillus cereus]PGT10249.1 hypothetical protein COD03_21115 [Bacillus cereus]
MGKARDLTGQKFNRLTVVSRLDYKHPRGGFMWLCTCDCGNKVEAPTHRITSGDIPSCGCQKREGHKNKRAKKPRYTFEQFISKLSSDYTYSCSDWKGVTDSEIEINCSIHGKTTRTSDQLRQIKSGIGCLECANGARAQSKTKSYEEVLDDLNRIHNRRYTYPESNRSIYINQASIIQVICEKHGPFNKKVQKHMVGQGCFECRVEEMIETGILLGGYSEQFFEENPEMVDATGFLYYFKIGDLYKIGITRTKVSDRVKSLKFASKQEVMVLDTKELNLLEAYKLEQYILHLHNDKRVYLKWSTEVFDSDVLNGKIDLDLLTN